MIKITINNQIYEVPENVTVFEACQRAGIDIPTLCHDQRLEPETSCNLCVVEIEGQKELIPACSFKVEQGMKILTDSKKVVSARKDVLHKLLADYPGLCSLQADCKLKGYLNNYGLTKSSRYTNKSTWPKDEDHPFFSVDPNKCIRCNLCLKVCSELQGRDAVGYNDKGHIARKIDVAEHLKCDSCGNCLAVCPTGALQERFYEEFAEMPEFETRKVRTTCGYCGVGCQLELVVVNEKVVAVQPVNVLPNNGMLCVKGKFGYKFINHPDRLKTPLIKKQGKFVEATWDEAYNLITSKAKELQSKYGNNALAGLSSARCTNEENYLFQKMFRTVFGSNNIDQCSRLCHSSTVVGLATTLGSGAMTNSINEVLDNDLIFVIGSNTTENHPVIAAKMRQAMRKGAKLIVADPRKIELAKSADIHLQLKPGTNIALINAMMKEIIDQGLYDQKYVAERTEDFNKLVDHLKDFTADMVSEVCGLDAEMIRKAARMYAEAEKAAIYYAMGITQHISGSQSIMLLSNLAMLCGNIGKEGVGVNPLRGQNNVQGACDMGTLPGDFPGYQKVYDPRMTEKFEEAWGFNLPNKPGLTLSEIIHGGEDGRIKFLYIMGENPMITDPDLKQVKKGLEGMEFLIVQDIFYNETAALADVVLPAASFAEKDGTFTNTERRVQRVKKAIEPIGNSKADWKILMEIMNRMGYEQKYRHPSEIMAEISHLTPEYGGITYDRLEEVGIQWPCLDKDHPGTMFLHEDGFERGRALFVTVDNISSAEVADADYPFIMTTGRVLFQYHSRTMTGRVDELNRKAPESFIEINTKTADRMGLKDEDEVKVTSRRGSVNTVVKATDAIGEDVMFMPFHYADAKVNYMTNPEVDPLAKIPELKVAAVRVERV